MGVILGPKIIGGCPKNMQLYTSFAGTVIDGMDRQKPEQNPGVWKLSPIGCPLCLGRQ